MKAPVVDDIYESRYRVFQIEEHKDIVIVGKNNPSVAADTTATVISRMKESPKLLQESLK